MFPLVRFARLRLGPGGSLLPGSGSSPGRRTRTDDDPVTGATTLAPLPPVAALTSVRGRSPLARRRPFRLARSVEGTDGTPLLGCVTRTTLRGRRGPLLIPAGSSRFGGSFGGTWFCGTSRARSLFFPGTGRLLGGPAGCWCGRTDGCLVGSARPHWFTSAGGRRCFLGSVSGSGVRSGRDYFGSSVPDGFFVNRRTGTGRCGDGCLHGGWTEGTGRWWYVRGRSGRRRAHGDRYGRGLGSRGDVLFASSSRDSCARRHGRGTSRTGNRRGRGGHDRDRVFGRNRFVFAMGNRGTGPAFIQHADATLHGRRSTCRSGGRRSVGGRGRCPFLDQADNLVPLVRLERAELILDIDSGLATQGEQVLALHVEFARERENAYLVFLQAQLPVWFNLTYEVPRQQSLRGRNPDASPILPGTRFLKRDSCPPEPFPRLPGRSLCRRHGSVQPSGWHVSRRDRRTAQYSVS
jgi:hypothetical protein